MLKTCQYFTSSQQAIPLSDQWARPFQNINGLRHLLKGSKYFQLGCLHVKLSTVNVSHFPTLALICSCQSAVRHPAPGEKTNYCLN